MAKQSKAEKKAAIEAYEKAMDRLESYDDGDGGPNDHKFWALNEEVVKAEKNVSWFRRNNW